ncbi:MAG: allophanate hydrolase, partial [Litoreibacter sp.]|nr:allophanate hydrolase [Litoreibacter sp.]
MSSARLKVVHAGPLVTLQDEGRFGALRYGVSAAGPMDRLGFASANASLARPVGQTAIEVSLGGLTLECLDGPLTLAITGGAFVLSLASQNLSGWQVLTLAPGEQLSIRGGNWGSWAYVAVAGQIEAQEWLGSAATASMTNFGGGALSAGKVLTVTQAEALPGREGPISLPDHYAPPKSIRVT